MKTLQRFVIVLGVFVFAYTASTIVHELGHGLTATATGGRVDFIEVSPLSWSYTHYLSNPEPIVTCWGGPLWETVIGLLAFFVLWVTRSRLRLIGVIFAMTSLSRAGMYMLAGALVNMGDPAMLMQAGVPRGVLVAAGSAVLLLALPAALPLGGLLGIGKDKNNLGATVLIFSPIMVYFLAMLALNLRRHPDEWVYWTISAGGRALLVVLASVVVHYSAPWCDGPGTQRRAFPVNWRTSALCLALGAGITVAQGVCF